MKVSDLGEIGLIQRFSSRFLDRLPSGTRGIGDDCAVIPSRGGSSLLVTTDMLVEDVHFLRRRISPLDLGYKSLAVNLSDIAAMGGKATSTFLSLAIPPDTEVSWVDSFFEGFGSLAEEFEVMLLGGDTTRSPGPIAINVAVLGLIRSKDIKYRSSARPGDVICVTDTLGDSAAGLRAILENRPHDEAIAPLIRRHHRPRPHLVQGGWLARQSAVHAMMDLSDGLNSDLRRILENSGCGVVVRIEQLPISDALKTQAARLGWNSRELAISGGEDYCLLLTVDAGSYEGLARRYRRKFRSELFRVGEITEGPARVRYFKGDEEISVPSRGYEHFG